MEIPCKKCGTMMQEEEWSGTKKSWTCPSCLAFHELRRSVEEWEKDFDKQMDSFLQKRSHIVDNTLKFTDWDKEIKALLKEKGRK